MRARANEVTPILQAAQAGDQAAAAQLLPLVYNELRKLAQEIERTGDALQQRSVDRAGPGEQR